MAEYTRPNGFRFTFGGLNVRSVPDSLTPNKYPMAQNVRSASDSSIIARPGYTVLQGSLGSITDIRAYSTLGTDDDPRFLIRNTLNEIFLDNGTGIVTLAGSAGLGVKMLPFRPSNSPQSWMYIAGVGDYQKLSAPVSGAVINQKVGIAEPLNNLSIPASTVTAVPLAPVVTDFTRVAANWTASGTAGTLSNSNLFTDTVGANILGDPLLSTRNSVQVGTPGFYIVGMEIEFSGGSPVQVQAVLPAIPTTTIAAIKYYSGSNGVCEIVLSADVSGTLQRGSIIEISSEFVFVNWALSGPNGTCTIETTTSGTYAAGATVTGVGAIIVYASPSTSAPITSPVVRSTITLGTGVLSEALATNPLAGYSADDYIHFSMLFQDINNLTSVTMAFTNSAGNSLMSYSVTGTSLIPTLGELFEIDFQMSQMTGFSGVPSTAANVMFSFVYAGVSTTAEIGGLWIGGGSQPDIGADGTSYQYRVVPRSALTGAQGNPCATMRYGVRPRRQEVQLTLPSAAYDSQIDTWDIYRYGGSLTSYRYLDSVQSSVSTYIDNTFDDSLTGTQVLATDNYEPWPSVDVPYQPTTMINVIGTFLVATITSGAPSDLPNWLPGTLIVTGAGTFTLRDRPVHGIGTTYTFEVEENGGNQPLVSWSVPEPFIAREINPYIWGPDAYGVIFGAGSVLRPGFLSYTKSYNPDSVPTTNNIELCPPSEPLIGGEVMNGLSYSASSKRWWAMYPSLTGTPAYQQIEIPVGHPLAAPYGLVSNGQSIFFWGPDGIYSHQGGAGTSLTDLDLYGLFPHDGIPGENKTRYGITVFAPDYSKAATFRLAVVKNYLYADYQDSTGAPRTLVCDLRNGSWSVDLYGSVITVHYAPEQTEGTLQTAGTLYPLCVMGDTSGNLSKQADLVKDNGVSIGCIVNTFEWDGGDQRASLQWGDLYVDGLFPYGGAAQPESQGANAGSATAIGSSVSRQFVTVPFTGGQDTTRFVGIQLAWTESPTGSPTNRTALYIWQPSVLSQPETTSTRFTDWYDLQGASYVRGFRMTADTFGQAKNLVIRNGDTGSSVTQAINFNGTQEIAFAFVPPFIAHTVRIEPDSTAWILFPGTVGWIKDKWPELTKEYSPWMNPTGTIGAKYLLSMVVPMDTNGQAVNLTVNSSDTNVAVSLGPFTTTAGQKTEVPIAFIAPFVCHEVQINPVGNPCRIWYDEISWQVMPYPELTLAYTPIMEYSTPDAVYVQGIKLTCDSRNSPVSFTVMYDGGQTGPTIGPLTFNGKETLVHSFTPFIGHNWQLIPNAPVRVFMTESKWVFEPTAESAIQWGPTQWTAHGMTGYQHVGRVEASYSSTATVTLTITSYDGTSPSTITLPSTGGVTQKVLLTPTFNKGQLYQYKAQSGSAFQIFLNDWVVWVKPWGSSEGYVPYRNLGGDFGDKAKI